jgi:AraC-like DNA-binding protein
MEYEGRYEVVTKSTGDVYHFQWSRSGTGRIRHGGREVTIDGAVRGVLLTPGRPARWSGDGGFREVTVNVDRAAVEDHYELLSGRALRGTIVFDPAIDATRSPGGRLAGLAETPTAFLDTLLLGLPHSHSDHLRAPAGHGSRSLVRRAEDYIEDRLGEPLTIRRVALALGVSMRTLQRSFARHRAYSPKRFLAERRLRRAHEMLLAGGRETVTAVALATGHNHLGQFSVDYRRRFGESPSATLVSRLR